MRARFRFSRLKVEGADESAGEVAAGFRLLALTPDQSAVPMDKAPLGDGLSSHWLDEADEKVCIPMSTTAMSNSVDSLNVVAAAAIACHGQMRT